MNFVLVSKIYQVALIVKLNAAYCVLALALIAVK